MIGARLPCLRVKRGEDDRRGGLCRRDFAAWACAPGEFSSKSGMRCRIPVSRKRFKNPSRDPFRTVHISCKYEKTCRLLVPAEQECIFLNGSFVIPAGAELDVAMASGRDECICRFDQAVAVECGAPTLGELIDLRCLSNRPFCHFCLSCRFTGRTTQPVRSA